MMIDQSRPLQDASIPTALLDRSLGSAPSKCDPGGHTPSEIRPGSTNHPRRDSGISRELAQIKDMLSSFSSAISSLKESLGQILSSLKAATPTPSAPIASLSDASAQNGQPTSGTPGLGSEGQATTLKEKIIKLVSDLVDLFTDSSFGADSARVVSKQAAEPAQGKKDGGIIGSIIDSVRDFGKGFLEKKGSGVIGKVLKMF